MRATPVSYLLVLAGLLPLGAAVADAAPGSGSADIQPSTAVTAGASGTWVIRYTADEPFDATRGGQITVVIPEGWTAPDPGPLVVPGLVEVVGSTSGLVDSMTVVDRTIVVYAGAAPGTALLAGDQLYVVYGVQAPAGAARAQQTAPATVTFEVASTPDGAAPVAPLTGGSPSVSVVPAAPVAMRWSPAALSLEAGVPRAVRIDIVDSFGNPSALSEGQRLALTATAGSLRFLRLGNEVQEVTVPADSSGLALEVRDTVVGGPHQLRAVDVDGVAPNLGTALAAASTGPGPLAAFAVTAIGDPIVAGTPSLVSVEALDAHANRVSDFAGTVRFTSSDPAAELPADYTFTAPDQGLHLFPAGVTLVSAGEQEVVVREVGGVAEGRQTAITVEPAAAASLRVGGIPDPLIAGEPGDVEVEALDPHGNRATGYTGTVRLLTSDPHPAVELPAPFTFTPADQGLRRIDGGVLLATAGLQDVWAVDVVETSLTGGQLDIEVRPGPVTSAALQPAGTVPVTVGGTERLVLGVADDFGNAVAGEPATIAILDPADGVLATDPSHPGGSQGSSTARSGLTAADGSFSVLYQAPLVAPAVDSVGAWTESIAIGDVAPVDVMTTADGATRLVWVPATALEDTAGAAVALTLEARDSFDNVDPLATPLVRITVDSPTARLSVDGGVSWSASPVDSLLLDAGTSGARLLVRDTAAGMATVTAVDASGFLVEAVHPGIDWRPAQPTYLIAITATPDTLTADGVSTLVVDAGQLIDRWGNAVGDAAVTVTTTAGDLVSPDQDPAPGLQRRTDTAGNLQCTVRAPLTAGATTITLASLEGVARRTVGVLFAAPLDFAVESVLPTRAVRGSTVAFTVGLRNVGDHPATLDTSTRIVVADQEGDRYESTLASSETIGGGELAALAMTAVPLPAELDGGAYTPLLELHGSDAYGATIDAVAAAPVGSFAVEVLELTGIVAPPVVGRGQQGVEIEVIAKNGGNSPLSLTDLGLDFSAPAYQVTAIDPSLPMNLPPRATRTLTVTCDVEPLATLGMVTIDAHASGTAGGLDLVVASARSPSGWEVVAGAELAAVPGSLGPATASQGQTQPLGIVVDNLGDAAVVLDVGGTWLEILQPGGGTAFGRSLVAATLVVPGGGTPLRFADLELPAELATGPYTAVLHASGLEHGVPYAARIELPDTLQVLTPAQPAVTAGSLAPTAVAHGQSRTFSIDVANSGGSPLEIEVGSLLRITGGGLDAPLASPVTVGAGETATVELGPVSIDPLLAPGSHTVELVASVVEHGLADQRLLVVADALRIDAAAELAVEGDGIAPARVTQGQEGVTWQVGVRHLGGAPLTVGLSGSRLELSDGVDTLRVALAGEPVELAAGGTATLEGAAADVPAALAAQDYAPRLRLVVLEDGVERQLVVTAPPAALRIERPAELVATGGGLVPSVVTPGDRVVFRAVIENRGGAAAALDARTTLAVETLEVMLDTLSSPDLIAGGAVDTLQFVETDLAGVVTAGAHAASIAARGTDWNGAPLAATLDLGPEALRVVNDGTLAIAATRSLAPAVHRVNTGQAFELAVTLANLGEETITGLEIEVDGDGLAAPATAGLAALAGGDTTVVEMPAVAAAAAGTSVLQAAVVGGVGAVSGDPVHLGPAADDTLLVVVERPAELLPGLTIESPEGARDGIVSTGSLLDVRFALQNQGDAALEGGGRLVLELPGGFGLLGAAERTFEGTGPVDVALLAPLGSAGEASLVAIVEEAPRDRNSGEPAALVVDRASLPITVVDAAELRVEAAIGDPASVRDGRVLPGQLLTIEGRVVNDGVAGVVDQAELEIELDEHLALESGALASRAVTVGETASWSVRVAATATGSQSVSVRLVRTPADENSGEPAAVPEPLAALVLTVAPAPVAVHATATGGASSPQVARGQADVVALAFTLTHGGTGSAPPIVLEAVLPRVRDDGGEPLLPADVVASLELRAGLDAAAPVVGLWEASAGGDPARVALSSPDTLAGGESRDYVLVMQVAPEAPGERFVLELPVSGAFAAREAASGTELVITLDAPISSSPVVVYEAPHNYPNPFAPGRESTRIAYLLERDGEVTVDIFTLFGDRVWSEQFASGSPGGRAGLNEIPWDGRNGNGETARNGVYLCRVVGAGLDARWKIALVR